MKKPLLECCVDCVESALAAKKGGADRLELCANLIIGGTTPDINLYHRIREQCDILINVLIRPRFGDFCYTDEEFEIIRRDVKMFREAGADGVVWFNHWGCKHTLGIAQLAKKKFEEQNLPLLILDGDGCDRSHGGEGQTATRLGAFMEMLGSEG